MFCYAGAMKVSKKQRNTTLDRLTYVAGILLPASTLPQAYNICVRKEVAGVSLVTWGFYLFSSSMFAAYGLFYREKLLILTYVPFVIIEAVIVGGLLLYK